MAFRADFLKRLPLLFLFLLAACSWNEPAVIETPPEAKRVIEPFLEQLAAGEKGKARAYVSSAAYDELDVQFAEDHRKLARAPKLKPRFLTRRSTDGEINGKRYGSADEELNIVYASKVKDEWISATVRVYRYRDGPFKVEYWRVTNDPPAPALSSDMQKLGQAKWAVLALLGAIVVFGLLTIGIVLWIVRRKPHVVAPEPVAERRVAAVTTREAENEGQ